MGPEEDSWSGQLTEDERRSINSTILVHKLTRLAGEASLFTLLPGWEDKAGFTIYKTAITTLVNQNKNLVEEGWHEIVRHEGDDTVEKCHRYHGLHDDLVTINVRLRRQIDRFDASLIELNWH